MRDEIKTERLRAAKQRRRSMSNEFIAPLCFGCGFSYSYIIEQHHVEPLAETERVNSETVHLCPTCHAMVHEIRRVHFAAHRSRIQYREDRIELLRDWRSRTDKEQVERLFDLAQRGIR